MVAFYRKRRQGRAEFDLLARNRAFVNRLSQVFLLAMGMWFVWTGPRG